MPEANVAQETEAHVRNDFEKIRIGVLAGLSPIAVKFVSRDSHISFAELVPIYATVGIGLVFISVVVCYLSSETRRMSLFLLALGAPAMIATASKDTAIPLPGPAPSPSISTPERAMMLDFGFIGTAHAAGSGESGVRVTGLLDNVKQFFGNKQAGTARRTAGTRSDAPSPDAMVTRAPEAYWVIVHSTKDANEAQQVAAKINATSPDAKAFVGKRKPNNPFYPVILGNRSDLDSANALIERGVQLSRRVPQIKGAPYLDTFPNRR